MSEIGIIIGCLIGIAALLLVIALIFEWIISLREQWKYDSMKNFLLSRLSSGSNYLAYDFPIIEHYNNELIKGLIYGAWRDWGEIREELRKRKEPGEK